MSSVKQRSKKSDSSLKSDEKTDQAADACMLIEDLKKNRRSIAVTVYEKCMTRLCQEKCVSSYRKL